MIRKYLVPILAAAGIGFGIATVIKGNKVNPPAPPVAEPSRAPYQSFVAGSGIVEASTENIAIGTDIAGLVSKIYVQIGSRVKAGDPLFAIDDRATRAQLAQQQAAVQVAAATLAQATNQLALAESLTDRRALSVQEVTTRRDAVAVADAKLAQARADLQATQTNLERLTVRAPIDGQVLQLKVRLGEFAQTGVLAQALILLGRVDPLCLRVDVDENDAWRVKAGASATAFLRGNRDIHTPLKFVRFEPYVIPKTSLTGDTTERVDNHLIAANIDRMKTAHPIRIDRHRAMLGPGGDFGRRDTLCHGKIQLVQVADGTCQAQAVVAELRRLRQLGVTDWSSIAVLSREHGDLARVRTLAERESIPIRWVAGRNAMPPLHQVREVNQFLAQLSSERNSFKPASELCDMAAKMFETKDNNVWTQFLNRLLEAWKKESGNAELPVQDALEFFYEACAESRREFTYGDGVTLSTVHSAKGTEFDHGLLIGPWRLPGSRKAQEEERRTFYVGLTRARKTLAVFDRKDIHPSLPEELVAPGSIQYQFTTEPGGPESIWLDYKVISLEDIHLGYPGQFGPKHRIHKALAALSPGDKLIMRSLEGNGIGLFDRSDECVARFSRTAQANWAGRIGSVREVRVLAIVRRNAEQDTQETRRERYLVQEWEIPVVEVVFADDSCG